MLMQIVGLWMQNRRQQERPCIVPALQLYRNTYYKQTHLGWSLGDWIYYLFIYCYYTSAAVANNVITLLCNYTWHFASEYVSGAGRNPHLLQTSLTKFNIYMWVLKLYIHDLNC